MLETVTYCPVLYTRRAEINALARLPVATKDLIFPVLIARPWPNANKLQAMWDKISEAIGEMRFGLDLDRTKLGSKSGKDAANEFDKLFDPADGYKNYYDMVGELERSIPVIRLNSSGIIHLDEQLKHIADLDRGLIIRIVHGEVLNPIAALTSILSKQPEAVVVLDAQWSRDLISRTMWVSDQVKAITELSEEAEIVVSGSSFPDAFADIEKKKTFGIEERALYDAVRIRFNSVRLIYSDWGSTRPPAEGGGRGARRIDLPLIGSWIVFRENNGETYQAIATRVVNSAEWPKKLNIWGTYAIISTADGLPGAIKGQEVAASARVNIHLHRQAQFDTVGEINDDEEPFTDF